MKKQFPDILMSLLLALLFILLQATVAVFIREAFGSKGAMLLAGVTIPAIVIIMLSAAANKTSFTEAIDWGVIRGERVLPIILMTLSAAVLASEMENVVADYVLPPEIYLKYLEQLAELFFANNRTDLLLGLVSLTIFGPLMEESFFRGIIYRGIAKNRGAFIGIVVSALLFMLVHANPVQFPASLTLGVLYAAMLARGYSVTDTFLSHALFNTITAFFFFDVIDFKGMSLNRAGEVVHVPIYMSLSTLVLFIASVFLVFRRLDGGEGRL